MTVMTITVMTVFKNDFLQLYMKCILYIIYYINIYNNNIKISL